MIFNLFLNVYQQPQYMHIQAFACSNAVINKKQMTQWIVIASGLSLPIKNYVKVNVSFIVSAQFKHS